MDADNLSYQKKPGTTPLRKPVTPVSSKYHSQGASGAITPYSKEHTKGEAVLVPAIVYVLSGGTTREKLFFKALMNDKILSSCVQVLFQSKEGQGLQPYQMNDIWQQGRKRGKITVEGKEYRLSKVDKVFLVTDVDEFELQLVKILSQKTQDDCGQWIISNPSIMSFQTICTNNC